MFASYPGFENLPIHVEVEWQGVKRWALVRLVCWPKTKNPALLCALANEENESEWVVTHPNGALFVLPESIQMAWRFLARDSWHDVNSPDSPALPPGTNVLELDEFRAHIKGAFASTNHHFRLRRVFYLHELPDEPRLVNWTHETVPAQFQWEQGGIFYLADARDTAQTRAQLLDEWDDLASDVRFAWQWARWSERERLQQLSGITPYFARLEPVMKLLLLASSPLHRQSPRWNWWFYPHSELLNLSPEIKEDESASELHSDAHIYYGEETPLQLWTPILLCGFQPAWRQNWSDKYRCVGLAWNTRSRLHGESAVLTSPTAHEQLEAKLALRDWLRDAATPDVAAKLLASLDD